MGDNFASRCALTLPCIVCFICFFSRIFNVIIFQRMGVYISHYAQTHTCKYIHTHIYIYIYTISSRHRANHLKPVLLKVKIMYIVKSIYKWFIAGHTRQGKNIHKTSRCVSQTIADVGPLVLQNNYRSVKQKPCYEENISPELCFLTTCKQLPIGMKYSPLHSWRVCEMV